jgi:hypothetical protein
MSPRDALSVLADAPRTTHAPTGVAQTATTCFENCSPLRTRCPGPAVTISGDKDGRWLPICRPAAMGDSSNDDGSGLVL